MLKLFKVKADYETGAWLSKPVFVGLVSEDWWKSVCHLPDGEFRHFDVFLEYEMTGGETCAIDVEFTKKNGY